MTCARDTKIVFDLWRDAPLVSKHYAREQRRLRLGQDVGDSVMRAIVEIKNRGEDGAALVVL